MTSDLALLGGPKTRTAPFPPYPVLGTEERDAVLEVIKEGRLSTFIAAPGEHFLGGKRIRQFEQEFADYHKSKFAVAFNSATAALHAAVVAVGVKPGEEVITTPYTFTSTASCALMHNAVPVFADIDADTFCLDPKSVESRVSPLSRAVIPVHLFGHPAPMDELLAVAQRHGLKVIEDCAQAPGARYKGLPVGVRGDCGIFSFQETKNIMTGEGGMLITNHESIAEVARLVRNHGEAVAASMTQRTYASQILGYGYRMTELEAAIGRVQFRHLDEWNAHRRALAGVLSEGLGKTPGLTTPVVRPDCEHAFYVVPLKYDEAVTGLPRDLFAEAVRAEGVPLGAGYVKPLYYAPLYQNRASHAFDIHSGKVHYAPGICPTAERMHFKEVLILAVARPPATPGDMRDIVRAFEKVLAGKKDLLAFQKTRG